MSKRIEKINQLIKEKLSEIIKKELSLKNTVLVTIVKVDTSKDLRYSKALLSVYPETDKDYVLKTLQKESRKIHKALHQELFMKPLPKIRFTLDDNQEKILEIEKIFQQIKDEK
jgi:ribosome-binding factor A